MNAARASYVGAVVRLLAAVVACAVALAAAPARASECNDDPCWSPLEPAHTGIERFRDEHHELGIVHGSGGPLAGIGVPVAVDGFHYAETNGEVFDQTLGNIVRAVVPGIDRKIGCSLHACTWLEATVFLPHLLGPRDDAGARGALVSMGLAFPFGSKRSSVFRFGLDVGIVSVRAPELGDAPHAHARDAYVFAVDTALTSWLTARAQLELNLFALTSKMERYRRNSPLLVGVHADLGRRVYSTLDFELTDILRGGTGATFGVGLRF